MRALSTTRLLRICALYVATFASLSTLVHAQTATADTAIRPFRVHVSAEALTDLRRRLQATRWPDKETVTDQSQGASLARLQTLVQYWGSGYDWHKAEATLNAFDVVIPSIPGYGFSGKPTAPAAVPPKGGHFAAWEQPELFAAVRRAAFKSLR